MILYQSLYFISVTRLSGTPKLLFKVQCLEGKRSITHCTRVQ